MSTTYKVWIHVERCDRDGDQDTFEELDTSVPHLAAECATPEEAIAFADELQSRAHDVSLSRCDACGAFTEDITDNPFADAGNDLCDRCMRAGVKVSHTDDEGNTVCVECAREDYDASEPRETVLWSHPPQTATA